MEQVRILRFAAPNRKGAVSRPGVIRPLRAPDQQNALLGSVASRIATAASGSAISSIIPQSRGGHLSGIVV
jgi:hypothetical protein